MHVTYLLIVVHYLGDSGYPAEPLLTPVSAPSSASEVAYNAAHTRTRNVIERCFGVMKSRFRCLDHSGGTLLYTPERACRIVTAVSVLHNFCINRNISTAVDAGVVARSAAIQPAIIQANPQKHRWCCFQAACYTAVLLSTTVMLCSWVAVDLTKDVLHCSQGRI